MSIFNEPDFQSQEVQDDMIEPTDTMGAASIDNQANQGVNGFDKGSPVRALLMLWFACVVAKWILAYIFRGNLK